MLQGNLRFIKLYYAYAPKCFFLVSCTVKGRWRKPKLESKCFVNTFSASEGLREGTSKPPYAASVVGTITSWRAADLGMQGAVLGFVALGVTSACAPGSFVGGEGGREPRAALAI